MYIDKKGICDFALKCNGKEFKMLQLTDMQIIDSTQRRTPDRINQEKIEYWAPENIERNCYSHIKSLVNQTEPDMIFITGDLVYGEFDDSGRIFTEFVNFMDSLEIPWAPVFGNHDNESKAGVKSQCDKLEGAKYCLFKRGNCTGFGNYSIGLYKGDEVKRIIYMLDSHGCYNAAEEETRLKSGIYEDQQNFMRETAKRAGNAKSFQAYHILGNEFRTVEEAKGYNPDEKYIIGVDTVSNSGDFGCKDQILDGFDVPGYFDLLKEVNTDGVFVGHYHCINTSILYDGVRWTFGLKTGVYDFYNNGQLGGTLITLDENLDQFSVVHVPTLVKYNEML
ncbi:MAG: metallophosphoesterase [Clostridia bacterium]|nr:metallophosphoesterase [Clostridia bacterium]